MHVLKFTQGTGETPDIYYLEETLGLSEICINIVSIRVVLEETIGFKSIQSSEFKEYLTETLGLNDIELYCAQYAELEESIGFSDIVYFPDMADGIETIGFGDVFSYEKIINITIEENIGYTEGGLNYIDEEYDMVMTWRTRTKNSTFGMGGTEYGAITSYGDGDADDLKSFKVYCYKNYIDEADANLVRMATITIVDTDFPDDDASFTYTVAFNNADNSSVFNRDMVFKIVQVAIDDTESPVQFMDFELHRTIPFLEV